MLSGLATSCPQGPPLKKEPKKEHLRWLTHQLQLRLPPYAASVPEMDATAALQVDDTSRQDSLRRGRVALLGCVLSKYKEALVELRFHRS